MSDETSWGPDPALALADAGEAADRMVDSILPPRAFLVAFAALVATLFSIFHVVPMSVSLWLLLLALPLGLWYFLSMRARPKPRTMTRHSGPYIGYALLLSLAFQASRFWEALLWWEVAAKWVVTFAFSLFVVSRLLRAEARSRLEDASERPV